MLFRDKQITAKTVKVRFYNYSDPNMGWGDSGTVMYATFPKEAFVEKEELCLPKVGGSYFTYKFTEEWYNILKQAFVSDCWYMGIGYEQYKVKNHKEEIAKAEAILKIASKIIKF